MQQPAMEVSETAYRQRVTRLQQAMKEFGIQAVVLNGAVIGKGCLVGAGAVVTERKIFADGCLILGAPAKVVRELTVEEQANLLEIAAIYVRRAGDYQAGLELIT